MADTKNVNTALNRLNVLSLIGALILFFVWVFFRGGFEKGNIVEILFVSISAGVIILSAIFNIIALNKQK